MVAITTTNMGKVVAVVADITITNMAKTVVVVADTTITNTAKKVALAAGTIIKPILRTRESLRCSTLRDSL